MLFWGIVCLVIAIICYALARYNKGQPLTGIAYIAFGGVGLLLVIVAILVIATRGDSIEIDSLRQITVR